jgi:hypothetical protein
LALSQDLIVTVVQTPVISSFYSTTNNVQANSQVELIGIFTNGTGVITPGNRSVITGGGIYVSTASTQIYTLTVTNSSNISVTATLTVNIVAAPVQATPSLTLSATNLIRRAVFYINYEYPSSATVTLAVINTANSTVYTNSDVYAVSSGYPITDTTSIPGTTRVEIRCQLVHLTSTFEGFYGAMSVTLEFRLIGTNPNFVAQRYLDIEGDP